MTIRFILVGVSLVLTSFILAFALAAFLAGYSNCSDCKTGIERVFLGVIWIFLGVLTGGRIPENESDMAKVHVDIWPEVYFWWLAIWATSMIITLVGFYILKYESSDKPT